MMIKKTISILLMVGLFASFLPNSLTNKANASDRTVSEFMAGQYYNSVIPDYDFVDINSLGVSDIQRVLVDNNSFLKDYHDNSATGAGRSAAQIIYDASHASYDAAAGSINGITINTSTGTISPKVLLVMLQKEQSLVSMQAQNDTALNRAMGYQCPDGGGCDPAYAGFAMQVGWAAWQLRYNYEYAARGIKNPGFTIHYVKNEGTTLSDYTGAYDVIMLNNATAALYSYTPHVFDSAYNFWKIFYRLFTAATLPNDTPPPYDGNGTQIFYRTHVQNIGWTDWKGNGETSGTTGLGLRVEAIQMALVGNPSLGFEFRAHIQNRGWSEWMSNSGIIGTTGLDLRIEAIEARITNSNDYNVYYQTHVEEHGWMEATHDANMAGTTGQNLRIEAIKMEVNRRYTVNPLALELNARAHVQNVGWTSLVGQNKLLGTSGRGLRLEAIQLSLANAPAGTSILYRVHVQNIGWMDWARDGQTAGTEGQSLRIEAIEIRVEGPQTIHVFYDGHVQNIGWMNQYYDGNAIGTAGQGLRLEALVLNFR
ncbi:MAG: hypothetical protein WC536_01585 [Patescibacteria group bacterium]